MTGIQPELWIERAGAAVAFYEAAFGATVLHRVGEGDDIVAQLAVDGAAFWVAAAAPERKRFSPEAVGGATSRTLLVVSDPDAVFSRAIPRRERHYRALYAWCLGHGRPTLPPETSLQLHELLLAG